MTPKQKREQLNLYSRAMREMETAHLAAELLASLGGEVPSKCVAMLRDYQQQKLRKMDRAAQKLGAPHGA